MDNIALFDLDGSLADFHNTLINDLNKIKSPDEPLVGDNLYDLEDLPFMKERMRLIKYQPGWWLKLPKIENGFKILRLCHNLGFSNHILTKGPKTNSLAWKEKLEWCIENVNYLADNVHVVSDKSLVYGKILYDDYPPYMLNWLNTRPRGIGIMPVTSYNQDFEHPRVIKWDGTNEDYIKSKLSEVLNRKSLELVQL